MAFGRPEEEEEDNLFDAVVAMADRLRLEGENRSNYIDDHMTEAGYTRIQTKESYIPVKNQDDEEDSTGRSRWFGGKKADPAAPTGGRRPPGASGGRRDDSDTF